MTRSLLLAILFIYSPLVLAFCEQDDGGVEDVSTTPFSLSTIISSIIDIPPSTHRTRNRDLITSFLREHFPGSHNSLKTALSRLSEEYLKASEAVFSHAIEDKYLPDSLTLVTVLDEDAILFDSQAQTDFPVKLWRLKIEFLQLALYYALQAKESLPKNLTVLRRHAETFKSYVLGQCGDPFEATAFNNGFEVSKYQSSLKKDLTNYAAFNVSIYQRILDEKETYNQFLIDLAFHMSNGTLLREMSTHPLNDIMTEYYNLAELWNRRHHALTTTKTFPPLESLSEKKRSLEEDKFESLIYKELELLTRQVLTFQTINAELKKYGIILSAKLDEMTGDNINLKAFGTAGVVDGLKHFITKYQSLLCEIHFERFWKLISLVGALTQSKSLVVTIDALDSIVLSAPDLTLATFNRTKMNLALVKAQASEIELTVLRERVSNTKTDSKSRSLLKNFLSY